MAYTFMLHIPCRFVELNSDLVSLSHNTYYGDGQPAHFRLDIYMCNANRLTNIMSIYRLVEHQEDTLKNDDIVQAPKTIR